MKSASMEFSTITEPVSIDNDEKYFELCFFFFLQYEGGGLPSYRHASLTPGLLRTRRDLPEVASRAKDAVHGDGWD